MDRKLSKLLKFNVAIKIDFTDVLKSKFLFVGFTFKELIDCSNSNLFESDCLVENKEEIIRKEERSREDIKIIEPPLTIIDFDKVTNISLPEKYDAVKGWWVDRQTEI